MSNKKWQWKKERRDSDIFQPNYGIPVWNAKGAYANRFGIGPDVIQVLA